VGQAPGIRLGGFLLLLAGWAIVLTAIAMLTSAARAGFALAGVAVEILGLTLVIRSHKIREERR
jgi:hypothetical protein